MQNNINMLRKLMFFIVLPGLMVLYQCSKNENPTPPVPGPDSTTIQMDFSFVYGNQDFVLNQVYNYPNGYNVKYDNVLVYISNVFFIDDQGNKTKGPEIILADKAIDSNAVEFKIPEGNYTQIEYSIGVPTELNGTDNPDFNAALYSSDHPLSLNNGMYWAWNSGYRFVRVDGRVNSNPMLDDEYDVLLSIHTGKEYSFRTKTEDYIINKSDNQPVSLIMTFNVEGFLNNPNDVIDIAVDNQSHGTNADLANRMMDNVIESITIN